MQDFEHEDVADEIPEEVGLRWPPGETAPEEDKEDGRVALSVPERLRSRPTPAVDGVAAEEDHETQV